MDVPPAERAAMARARELGAGVLGTTSPNPHESGQLWPHRHGPDAVFRSLLRRPA